MDSQETGPHRIRRRLGRLLGVAAATLLAVGAVAMSGGVAHAATTITSNSTGTNNGYFYSFWEQDSGGATMTLGSGSNYQLSWTSASNDVVAGTGWATGSTAPVTYSGSWNCNGNCYLSLYGWTTNPLVEFYITDAYGDYNPSSGDSLLGTVNSDGGTYDLYEHQQVNQPCITGNSCTFEQYWAVRTSQRIGGTITVANIFNAWAALGLNLGTPNYEILATEGYQSSGSSNITVSQGSTGTTGGGNTVTVSNPGSQTATVGTAVSKQISATDSGGASLTYSASGLPAGLSISSSGDITGTPTTAGTSSVTVTAKDSTGATGSTTFTYTVSSSGGTTGGGGGSGGSGSCTATYTTSSSWSGGWNGQISIKAGSSALSTWTVTLTLASGETVTSNYNGGYSQSGSTATLTPASYNASLAAGASTSIGIQGTSSGSYTAPTVASCT